jgi:hypothetical protein
LSSLFGFAIARSSINEYILTYTWNATYRIYNARIFGLYGYDFVSHHSAEATRAALGLS